MSPNEQDDHDLVDAFQALRTEELESCPPFSEPSSRSGLWRLGLGVYAGATVALAMAFLWWWSLEADLTSEAVVFEQFPEIIAREVYASSASSWQAPTHFLIDTEFQIPAETE